jgi:hypothetical protein
LNPGDTAALLDAVHTASLNDKEDTINLAPGATYSLTTALEFSDVHMTTIHGNGATLTRDSARRAFRIIDVRDGAALSVDGVTITNGLALDGDGGGILVGTVASVRVTNSTISGNATRTDTGIGGNGGGIYLSSRAWAFIIGSDQGFGNGVLLCALDSDGDGLPNFFIGLSGLRLY